MFLSLDEAKPLFQHGHVALQVSNKTTFSSFFFLPTPSAHLKADVFGSLLDFEILSILQLVKAPCGNAEYHVVAKLQLLSAPVVFDNGHPPLPAIKLNNTVRGITAGPSKEA